MARELTKCQEIERSIIKKYREELWNPFIAAVKRYELINEGDRVAVCISGGKDSMLMAKLVQQLQKNSDVPFEVEFICMDPGYNKENREQIEKNAALLEIPIQFFSTDIFDYANKQEKNPCYMCARMRRGHLYAKAQSLGCNKIALGHHRDDVAQTLLMNLLFKGAFATIPPILPLEKMPLSLIRPLYLIDEAELTAYAQMRRYQKPPKLCPFEHVSSREKVKDLLTQIKALNPEAIDSLYGAMTNIKADYLPH